MKSKKLILKLTICIALSCAIFNLIGTVKAVDETTPEANTPETNTTTTETPQTRNNNINTNTNNKTSHCSKIKCSNTIKFRNKTKWLFRIFTKQNLIWCNSTQYSIKYRNICIKRAKCTNNYRNRNTNTKRWCKHI